MSHRTCESYQELVSALVDDALPAAGIEELRSHLGDCGECRAFMDSVRRTRELLRAADASRAAPLPPPAFAARLAEAARKEPLFVPAAALRQEPRRWSPFAAAAAAILLLAGGWSWYSLAGKDRAVPTASLQSPAPESDEGSMASLFRQHALQTMGATFLGPPEEIELARFETAGKGAE